MDDEPGVPGDWATFAGSAASDRWAAHSRNMDGAVGATREPSASLPSRCRARWRRTGWILWLGTGLTSACHSSQPVAPESVSNRLIGRATIAVAPALNLSGSADFDPSRFADLMASELSFAEGIRVIPVSRVLGVLAAQGLDRVESARHAGELAEWLGADAVLVFAVTEYDPYDPPSIGISAQLYGSRPRVGVELAGPVDPGERMGEESRPPELPAVHVLAESQRVFDAAHDAVVAEIRAFASSRDADGGPYGWRRYVVSQQEFIRFCCHATIHALLTGEGEPVAAGGRLGR